MKQELRQIYADLRNGKLSQIEALERIKAIKLEERGKRIGALLATPVWQPCSTETSAAGNSNAYAERHIILCELPKVNVVDLESQVAHSHCLSLQVGEKKSIAQRYCEYALVCFERIQTILRGKPLGNVLVQIVIPDVQEQTLLAGLSGLLKTALLENPRLIGQLILTMPQTGTNELVRQLEAENPCALHTLIRYDQGSRLVWGWQEVPVDAGRPPGAFKDQGVYLITGGLGGLGRLFTKEILAQTRQAKVVLSGRSAISTEKQSTSDGLSTPGEQVSYRQVDLGNLDQVRRLVAAIKDEYGQLNGILHSAGTIADNFILKKPSAEFSEVLEPKVIGTFNLDLATQDVRLDFFVLFSSIAGAMGNVGQADYAAANGFMDQFAAYRNRQVAAKQRHGRTRSINWGLWQAGGMNINAASQDQLQEATGIRPMQTGTGIQAFYRSLELPYHQMLVVEGNVTQLRDALLAGRPIQPEPSRLLAVAEQSVAAKTDTVETNSDDLTEKTQDYLRRQFSELLRLPSHKIDPQAALEEYGIDSILAMKLTNQLERTFGSLSKTLFFEYQTIHELTKYFTQSHWARLEALFATTGNGHSQMKGWERRPEVRPRARAGRDSGRRFDHLRTTPRPTRDADPIAIIGLSGRYPEAVDIKAYWRNLREGKDCIIEVPRERWDWREYFSEDRSKDGCHYSKWGGFIAGVDEFDPLFFNIAPKEAKYIDPQERLFLQHAWMAVEDAGYTRASLQAPSEPDLPGQVGVYVGVMYSEYQLFGAEASAQGKRLGIVGSAASIANRVSYVFNLHGPSMTLDTMCSSSLTAIHIACQDLKLGRTSLAIAGGVNVSVHPNKYLLLSAGQFISSDGHCQSFGEGGDGYIPGEGVGVVVLKRLSEAKRDGDHIYGIIRGSAINHGGKTNGYTVPNPQAQSSAISRALAESKTEARHISYIEAHGTGTKLGDPIEIAALSKAFEQDTQDSGFCRIGSVKSNIGHCESAAGIAGLSKVLLQMQHEEIVPSLHSGELNPHIDFGKSPFVVNQELRVWERPVIDGRKVARIAGISSFGAGGSNAHLIVEEYPVGGQAAVAMAQVAMVLSARTGEQLGQKVRDLLEFLGEEEASRIRTGKTIDLVGLAYTLQVGREAMEERVGLVVSSVEQLVEKLAGYVAGEGGIEGAYQGQVKRGQEGLSWISRDADLKATIDKWLVQKKLSKLVELWVKGGEVDWSQLYGEGKPQRMSLPGYPFAKERYWIERVAGRGAGGASGAGTMLHPLLHCNTSDLSEQRYSSSFTGEEFFLSDHQVKGNGGRGEKVLPGVAYLEMARAAMEQAMPGEGGWRGLEMRHVVWAQPVVVRENKQISIALLAKEGGAVEFEIYSEEGEQETVHCQGEAAWSGEAAPARVEVEQLKGEMGQGQLEREGVYAAWGGMGVNYGPGLQAITALQVGNKQVLAQLQLPSSVAEKRGEYVLHPSLMDGALQGAVGLIEGLSEGWLEPRVPFALERMRLVSPCVEKMVAWVRYQSGSQAGDKVVKLDIDLCDERGNVCVQMHGVRWQLMLQDISQGIEESSVSAQPAHVEPTHQPVDSDFLPEVTVSLKTLLAGELQMRESDIGENVQFVDLGLDSITGVTWVRKINEKYQASIEAIKLYSYPTLTQLSRYVKEEAEQHGTLSRQDTPAGDTPISLGSGALGQPKMATRLGAAKLTSWRSETGSRFIRGPIGHSSHSIAVIGMAGQFPQAKNLEEFWQNIAQGRNCISPVPPHRWDMNAYYDPDKAVAGKTNCKWVGALEEYDRFDPLFFNISPKDAKGMDPQQRLFLQACWHTIENAGYNARSLSGLKCGVFVGCTHGDYHLLSREQQLSVQGFTGDAMSILAGRISYFLDLRGPCLSIDTACSSSLVAIVNGCDSLICGGSDLVLAGGVYVMTGPEMHIKTAQAGMLSSEGKCFTFDQRADGFVPGEGVGVVMLKRLADAQRDRDIIYGVIEGWGINQDGKTNGITAPNLESQTRLEQEVYDKYQIDPASIQLIEAHGTGTKLGDPIEVEGLKKAFQKYTANKQYCALGSVKSNIGHCMTAAGIAGFIKLMLALQHKQLPPTINFERLNEHIELKDSPFYVNLGLQEWKLNGAERRRGAISSLGFSGTNAHLVIGEYLPPVEVKPPVTVVRQDQKVAMVLSARTGEQLGQKVRDLLEFLGEEKASRIGTGKTIDLVGLAYTLQVGREAMEERVGLVVSSVEQLVEKLAGYVAGKEGREEIYQGSGKGQGKSNKELLSWFSRDADLKATIDKWLAQKKLSKLVELWVKGGEVDWSQLYGEGKPQRMSLPGYPFAKERYWIETRAGKAVAAAWGTTPVLHPLLQRNRSDLREQSYSSTFTGDEFFLGDEGGQAKGEAGGKELLGVAYLEMARVAMEQAMPWGLESKVLELRHVVWGEPLVVSGSRQVSIALMAKENEEIEYEIYSQGEKGEEKGEEIIHCQGRAVWSDQVELAGLEVEELKAEMRQGRLEAKQVYAACARMGLIYGPRLQAITGLQWGNHQVLAQLRLPGTVGEQWGDYVLHPSLMAGVWQAAMVWMEGGEKPKPPRRAISLERLRIVSRCTREMMAWVRYAVGSEAGDKMVKLDIDLSDEVGNICVQMRGVSWQAVRLGRAEPAWEKAVAMVRPGVSKEIAFHAQAAVIAARGKREKPRGIALTATSTFMVADRMQPSASRPQIALGSAGPGVGQAGSGVATVCSVRMYDEGEGIFSIRMGAGEGSPTAKERMGELVQALERVQQEATVKVLKLHGLERCFQRGGREECNQAVGEKLYQEVVNFPYPVIAVLVGDVIGAGMMAAGLCDLMVCNEDASYGYSDGARDFYATSAEADVLEERFGTVGAQELLEGGKVVTGRQLRRKGWTCAILPGEQMEGYAQSLAMGMATKSQVGLRLLKQHLSRELAGLVKELRQVEVAAAVAEPAREAVGEESSWPREHNQRETAAENVVVLKFGVTHRPVGRKELVAELGQLLGKMEQAGGCQAIVVAIEDGGFVSGSESLAEEEVQEFQGLMAAAKIPVVAALAGNAKGQDWLISQFCDACVYSRTGMYSAGEIGQSRVLGEMAAATFIDRLGKVAGQEILLTGGEYSGAEIERRVGRLLVAEQDQVLARAIEVAESWARWPQSRWAAWKKHSTARQQEKMRSLRAGAGWEEAEEAEERVCGEPTAIALHSKVVTATAHPEGIVVVKMEDREAKNMFSEVLQEGMREVFAHIEQTSGYKVVILTGYDSYFSCGGTKESLLAIQAGQAKFTDFKIFQLPLDCKLPVIAAMQGHGIGAGWSLGMFADLVLLSEESRYVSPYMNYGFTPGAGATWVLGDKLGYDLARESLLTGQQCSGREWKERGLRLPIVPRAEVAGAAMGLAKQIAQGSRRGLIGLKQRLTGYVHPLLEETYRLELAMHEKTFTGQSDTLAQIHKNFYQEPEAPPTSAPPQPVEAASPSVDQDELSAVTASLKTLLGEELHIKESEIEEEVEFVDLGLDSISGVTWVRKINEKYHTSIEATKVYSYPTLTQLSRYVKEEAEKQGRLSRPATSAAVERRMASGNGAAWQPRIATTITTKLAEEKLTSWRGRAARFSSAPAPQLPPSSQPIAVIGMAGQFPQAKNLEEFWQNIAQGRNCISPVPPHRWDMNAYYDPDPTKKDKVNSKWLGVLDDIDCFDPLFFRISPQEAEYIDPQHRLFLQESYKAFEDAGYASNTLGGKKCGVYLGISAHEYPLLLSQNGFQTMPITSNSHAIAAARIAYYLNLKGPAIAIDTACSSSLVAVHLACQALLNGETDMALAGGVSVWLNQGTYISFCQSGGLSSAGQCKTFDDAADGVVLSEGVGAVVLKRLKDAQKDNDFIRGVILGSGINQDGRTNGITAPSVISQAELERSVYEKYNIDPGTITYVETHGAGSALGDPIELEALATAFKEKTTKKNYCALGSVKSNIGHTAAAAGVTGMLKVLLSLQHRTLVPVLNVTKENSHFDFESSPFYVCREKQAWDAAPGSLRRAAVSSFGYSGTNAHLIIEEYLPPVGQPAPLHGNTNFIVPLSARTPEQLRQKARDLLGFICAQQVAYPAQKLAVSEKLMDLASIAYTLQIGREAMEERSGFVVNSVDQLAEQLSAYINGDKSEGASQGCADATTEGPTIIGRDNDMQGTIDKWIRCNQLSKLLNLWVRGLNFDWNKLYGDVKPQRISLPAYPFSKERCWIPQMPSSQGPDREFEEDINIKSIEDIINQIDDDMIETKQAVQELRSVSALLH